MQFKIEVSPWSNGPWYGIETITSDTAVPVYAYASRYSKLLPWGVTVRIVRDGNFEEPTLLLPWWYSSTYA